jgi:hypothetical protein
MEVKNIDKKEYTYMFDKNVYRLTLPLNMSEFFEFMDKNKPNSIFNKVGQEVVKIKEYHDFNSVICSIKGEEEKEKTYLFIWLFLSREPHKFYFN